MFKRKPDFIVAGPAGEPYLLRWWIIPRNKYFNIYLHKFLQSDDARATHDHPWHSCSIILKGGYWEHTQKGLFWRKPRRVYVRRATAAHRVELKTEYKRYDDTMFSEKLIPAWTIFITGPKIREWGFLCPKGWRHWREFYDLKEGEQKSGAIAGRGCDD